MIAAARPGIRENVGCTTVYTEAGFLRDTFNRPDAGDNTLGVADSGQQWVNVPGNAWGGLTNSIITDGYWTTQGTNPNTAQAKVITIDHYRAMRTAINAGGNNQDVTFTFSTADDDYTGCVVRANADTSCGYEIGFSHYGSGTVSKYVDGVGGSPIATWSATSLNTAHTARVRVWRNSLKVWRDGTLVADITIDPDDAGGHCETDWRYFAIGENHGGSGGSAPTQQTVYTNTWLDNLSVIPTVFTDDFNRADSTMSVGNGWSVLTRQTAHVTKTWGLSSGRAYCSATPTYAGSLDEAGLVRNTNSGDFDMTFTLATYHAGPFTAPVAMFRADPAQDDGDNGLGYFLLNRTDLIQVTSNTGGGTTWGGFSLAAGDVVRIVANGTSIQVYQSGTRVVNATSTYNQTAKSHGLASFDSAWDQFTFDDFTLIST